MSKAVAENWKDKGNDEMIIQCTNFSCYVDKAVKKDPQGNEWSNDPEVEIHVVDSGDHSHPRDQADFRGTSKDDTDSDRTRRDGRAQPLIGQLTTSPKIRPTSVVGTGTIKDDSGAEGSNGDYNLNLTEVSTPKDEKKKQTVSTTQTAVGDVIDTVNDDKKAPALEKDLGSGGTENQNMPGTRGFGATRAHQQGPGESTQISLVEKDPEEDEKKKVHLIDSEGHKWYEEQEAMKALIYTIKLNNVKSHI